MNMIERAGTAARPLRAGSIGIAAAAALIAACSPAQNGVDNASPPADVVAAEASITMQRQPCFGTCPVYTVNIAGDGTVTFTGERFVQTTGTASADIGAPAATALVREMVARGFLDLADRYTQDSKECTSYHTDAPRVILTLSTGGRTKTVEHDHGCGGVPEQLRALQERVDSVAGVERWVGRRD